MKGKRKLTPRGAVWAGLLATPVLIVAVVAAIGVAVAPAGPSHERNGRGRSRHDSTVTHASTGRRVARSRRTGPRHEWSRPSRIRCRPGRALRRPQKERWCRWRSRPARPAPSPGHFRAVSLCPRRRRRISRLRQQPQHTPYHDFIPYTRWSLIGRYAKFPNFAVLKMFFSQDHDGNGSLSNFVCSASSMGPDEAWTAGHCVSNNLSGAGANAGFSTNVLVCPVYDNGINPAHGCWGADTVVTLIAYRNGGNGNVDFGAIDTSAHRNRGSRSDRCPHRVARVRRGTRAETSTGSRMGYPQGHRSPAAR